MICRASHTRTLVENCPLAVDIDAFVRAGIFELGDVTGTVGTDDGAVAFAVQHRGEEGPIVRLALVVEAEGAQRQIRAVVPTVTTEQRVGTRRWWACPMCGRRAKIVYLVPGTDELSCRLCGGLIHRSAAEHTYRKRPLHLRHQEQGQLNG